MKYSVNQLAKMANVSVRTIHYYDQIGLLTPSFVKKNGYRYYQEDQLLQLQQILLFKELEFSLDQIRRILDSPNFDQVAALVDQHELLSTKKNRIEKLMHTINQTIDNLRQGTDFSPEGLYESFTKTELELYQQEAQYKWGSTAAYHQSMQRARNWTKQDYIRVEQEAKNIISSIVEHMDEGPESEVVQTQIERFHQHVNQFYDCSYDLLLDLGNMYVDDSRFTNYYDKFKPGLAVFLRDAIFIYYEFHTRNNS